MELLVVLSVIAVLAGMLLPTISQVRRSAQIAGCMSNLRQLGMANLAYANENQGTYVPGFGFDAYGAPLYDTTRWSQNKEFLDYLCNDGRDHAADGSLPRGLICPRVRNITDSTAVTTSYGLNQWSLRGGWWPNTYCTTRVGQTSGNVMMFGDGLDWLLRDGVSYRPEFEGTYNLNGIVAFRHGHDSMVAVLYDGSTPLVPKTAFVYATPYWWD